MKTLIQVAILSTATLLSFSASADQVGTAVGYSVRIPYGVRAHTCPDPRCEIVKTIYPNQKGIAAAEYHGFTLVVFEGDGAQKSVYWIRENDLELLQGQDALTLVSFEKFGRLVMKAAL